MDEQSRQENREKQTIPEQPHYVPRPAWQVWAARAGLVAAIGFVIYQILCICRGGL